ncbi:MAG: hypothetical protein IJ565_05300 [Bacilli bacterium]|nr:hypothetical protein [Bacilli bacterium]
MEIIKNDIESFSGYNKIYYLGKSEKDNYNMIKELLTKDYGFLDIVLDFKDYGKLKPMYDSISKDKNKEDIEILKNFITRTYLYYSILTNSGVNTDEVNKALFNGDINDLLKVFIDFESVSYQIKEKALEKEHAKARIHFFLDEVLNETLQKNINDIFIYRSNIVRMGYTTMELQSYTNTLGYATIESPHDYQAYCTKAKRKELK